MAIAVLIDHIGNPVHATTVHAYRGDKVTFRATDSVSGNALDGTWQRGNEELRPVADGKVEVTAGPDTVGQHVFTAKDSAETAQVTLELQEKSGPTRSWSRFWKTAGGVLTVLAGYTGLVFYFLYGPLPPRVETDLNRSFYVGALTVLAMFILADVSGRLTDGRSGIPGLLKGSDQRASTSKIQYLIWTIVLGFVVAYVAAYAGLTDGNFQCSEATDRFCLPGNEDTWTPYLILLGVPAATAAVAKGIVSTKVSNGTLQKTEAQQASLADVATNDAGSGDLVDIQYLLFNLIAMVYVTAHFATKHTLPDVPDLLLGLTSAAAGTYVLNKSLLNNKPMITSVTPSSVKPGDVLTVKGEHLLVTDSAGEVPQTLAAKVAGIAAVAERDGTSTDTVTIVVPEGLPSSSATSAVVTVTTKANIETDGFPISLLPITVLGWKGSQNAGSGWVKSAPAAGVAAQLAVTGLPARDQLTPAERNTVQVTIAGLTAPGEVTGDNEITVQVPPGVTSGEQEVTVAFQGRTSATAKLPIG